jgi:N-acetylneuraminate synthase
MSKFIQINDRKIGQEYPPYIIAEISANHNGDINNAFKLIELAKKSGSDAVKMQTYRPDTITIDCDSDDFQIRGGLWGGQTLYKLYESAHTPWEWHRPLFDYAKKLDITIFSSPFDNTAVDLLESLNAPAYKIASFEAIDLPLIRYVANTGKPMIISTGMASIDEINEAIEAARIGGCKSLAILHCVSGYPALSSDYNLKTLPDMIARFNMVTGLSDHTLDNTTAIASIALGASIIEKHFTLCRSGGGPDDSFSLEPSELTDLCRSSKIAWAALGEVNYSLKGDEISSVQHRRSLYFVRDLKVGEIITDDAVKSIRPGHGIPPKNYDLIIGKRVLHDVCRGTPVKFEHFLC